MKTLYLYFCLLLITLLSSCTTQNLFNKPRSNDTVNLYKPYKHVLTTDDKISVSIWNHDDLSIGSVYGIYNSNEVYGKWVLVDANGFVKLPVVGDIKLGGLTLQGAKDTLVNVYGKFIKEPVIEIKVLNLEVTILGEVKTPGNYTLEKTDNHLIEILGRAGGFNFYANKTKIKIIRGDVLTGKTKEINIDLTDMKDVQTGKLQLYPNDIIYVASKNGKLLDKKAPILVPFASAVSALAVIAAVIFNNGSSK